MIYKIVIYYKYKCGFNIIHSNYKVFEIYCEQLLDFCFNLKIYSSISMSYNVYMCICVFHRHCHAYVYELFI